MVKTRVITRGESIAHMDALASDGLALDPTCGQCLAAFNHGLAYPHKGVDR